MGAEKRDLHFGESSLVKLVVVKADHLAFWKFLERECPDLPKLCLNFVPLFANKNPNQRQKFYISNEDPGMITNPGGKIRLIFQARPTWRIIPISKWLVTPIYKPFRPFVKGTTPVRGLTNHGY